MTSISSKLQKHSEFPIITLQFYPLGTFIDKNDTYGKYLLVRMLSYPLSHDKNPLVYLEAIYVLFDMPLFK